MVETRFDAGRAESRRGFGGLFFWALFGYPLIALSPGLSGCSQSADAGSSVEANPADQLGKSQEAIIDGTPYPTLTAALVLVNNEGTGYTEETATRQMFGIGATDASAKQWFLEASYGRQDLEGRVLTGFNYDLFNCDYRGMTNALRSQVDSAFGTAPPHHYLWRFPQNNSCASSLFSTGRDSFYAGLSGCSFVWGLNTGLGSQIAYALRCGNQVFANDPTTCTRDFGNDDHDPMGSACRHNNAANKVHHGWLEACNGVRVNESGTFTLHPLELECNGIQVLQVPMPITTRRAPNLGNTEPVRFYYLELRTRVGFDLHANTVGRYPTVLVRVGDDFRTRAQNGPLTWILDMNPMPSGDTFHDGMSFGQTFTDPAGGVSFTVQAIDSTSATISVTVPTSESNTCLGGGTLNAPGPSTCGATGTGGMGGMGGAAGSAGSGTGGMAGSAGLGGAGAGGASAGGAGASGTPGGGNAGIPSGGTSGEGGASGEAGAGGDGTSGEGGTSDGGASGGGGRSGEGGTSGAAGTNRGGSAGAGAVAGAGAAAGTGAAPRGGNGGGGADDDDSGCDCRIGKAPPRDGAALSVGLFGLAASVMSLRRRRRTRLSRSC